MRMSSVEFWALSVKEWILALEGFIEFNGGGAKNDAEPWTDEEAARFAKFEQRLKRKQAVSDGG